MNNRHQLTITDLQLAAASVAEKLDYRVKQKGLGTMASCHEILGILEEELAEYRVEVHAKTDAQAKIEELKDIAVGAIFGIASIQSGGVDW